MRLCAKKFGAGLFVIALLSALSFLVAPKASAHADPPYKYTDASFNVIEDEDDTKFNFIGYGCGFDYDSGQISDKASVGRLQGQDTLICREDETQAKAYWVSPSKDDGRFQWIEIFHSSNDPKGQSSGKYFGDEEVSNWWNPGNHDRKPTSISISRPAGVNAPGDLIDPSAEDDIDTIDDEDGSGGSAEPDECAINSRPLAWILCPFLDLANRAITNLTTDKDGKDAPLRALLKVRPLANTQLQLVWEAIRNVANVFFVFAFLIIIFANTLSINLNAYTVKKMLPKLVVAVVLVQFSFLLSGIIVDVGNVAGDGIVALIQQPIKGIQGIETYDAGGMAEAAAGIIAAGITVATVAIIGIPFVLLLAGSALISLAGVVITLLLRQLLVSMFVILSPIALATWVLPNTEGVFKYWYKNFTKLVLMYPIIMLLMSVGGILGTITAADKSNTVNQVAAALFPIVAFFMIPATFKMGGALMGAVGGAITGRAAGLRKKFGESEYAKDAREKKKGNIRSLAAGTGVPLFGGRAFGGVVGKTIGRTATLDASGRRVLANFNKSTAAAKKELDENGLADNRKANELIATSRGNFNRALSGQDGDTADERAANQALAKQVQRFRGSRFSQAAAGMNYTRLGGSPGAIRQNVRDHFGDSVVGRHVWGQTNSQEAARKNRPSWMRAVDINGNVNVAALGDQVTQTTQGDAASWTPDEWQLLEGHGALDHMIDNGGTDILRGLVGRGGTTGPKSTAAARVIIDAALRRRGITR